MTECEQAICDAYTARRPVKEILERFDLHVNQLYRLLQKRSIPKRWPMNERNAAIREESHTGATVRDLAAKYGISPVRVRMIKRTGR